MNSLEIARKFSQLGEMAKACKAYKLALGDVKDVDPAAELECALHILQFGSDKDYKISYTCLCDLYNRGFARDDILAIMDSAFYQPNIKAQRRHYEKNCRLLAKYPYFFRQDFPPFEDLPIIFFPYDDRKYALYHIAEQRFGAYFNPRHQVVSRNFFKDLANPILAADVFSQYELEYLNDNVRKSEYVGRENHIYLHYTDWPTFCAYLQVLDWQALLKEEKIVFLIEDEIDQYPIDFRQRFGIDYSQYKLEPLHIREINRIIWHTQLSSDNGGDFFNEVFDAHPNLLTLPSVMFDDTSEKVGNYLEVLSKADSPLAAQKMLGWDNVRLASELYSLRDRTEKDMLVAVFMEQLDKTSPYLDKAARIVPALFFQPHFHNIFYNMKVDSKGNAMLDSEQYEQVRRSPLFRGFKYIKTFTPMRTISCAYAATVKYKCFRMTEFESKSVMDDSLINRILNRSFMIDWQDRLFKDCRLVRFEDGKLNAKATFTALAAFLDLPYTESMTYCSMYGEHDPQSDVGNERGFDPATIYRKNEQYGNDSERAFIEFCMRDVYKFYGYDFEYYDGSAVDEARLKEWFNEFTIINKLIVDSREKIYAAALDDGLTKYVNDNNLKVDEQEVAERRQNAIQELKDKLMKEINARRLIVGRILMRDDINFINRNGQPLHMMPLLEPDPELLVMPLYRSTTYPHVEVEVPEVIYTLKKDEQKEEQK